MNISVPSNEDLVDRMTCERIGSLLGHGLTDEMVADALCLTIAQVVWAKETPEFTRAFAAKKAERVNAAVDQSEALDALEEESLAQIMQAMKYNRDPNYALVVARFANTAKRRTPADANKPIEPQRQGQTVVILNLNKNYVAKIENATEMPPVINVRPPHPEDFGLPSIEPRRSDTPTPKRVMELLGVGTTETKKFDEHEIEEALIEAGVFERK